MGRNAAVAELSGCVVADAGWIRMAGSPGGIHMTDEDGPMVC